MRCDIPVWTSTPSRITRACLPFWKTPFTTLDPATLIGSFLPLIVISKICCTVASPCTRVSVILGSSSATAPRMVSTRR